MSPIYNFGENVLIQPSAILSPKSDAELMEMLSANRTRKIRVIGSKHSWSQAICCTDLMIELSRLNNVAIRRVADQVYAEIGAGCRIEQVLEELNRNGLTLPSLGLITKQTVAGAMSTGTHGSGRHSLAHYMHSARVIHFCSDSIEPVLELVDRGDELLAIRCALGCLGIITSLTIPVIPQFQIEEHFRRYVDLESVLAAEDQFPLQQCYLGPWRWDYFAQHRRPTSGRRSRSAFAYRLYWRIGMDVVFHWMILALARFFPTGCTKFFYRHVLGWLVPRRWKVVDRSDRQLTMEHQLFRHIEIELFVNRSQLSESIDYVKWLLRFASGENMQANEKWQSELVARNLWRHVEPIRGKYCQHYPICIRKVLPDATLISMASGTETYYALSFISYALPEHRQGFEQFAKVIATTMARLFEARPHWGKYCPLPSKELRSLYPAFSTFVQIKRDFDPQSRFDNAWTEQLLGGAVDAEKED